MPFKALYASVQLNHLNKGFYQFEIIKTEVKRSYTFADCTYTNLIDDATDKDEDFWQSSFLSMWPVLEPKSATVYIFFSISVNKETISEYTYYRYLWKSFEIF